MAVAGLGCVSLIPEALLVCVIVVMFALVVTLPICGWAPIWIIIETRKLRGGVLGSNLIGPRGLRILLPSWTKAKSLRFGRLLKDFPALRRSWLQDTMFVEL